MSTEKKTILSSEEYYISGNRCSVIGFVKATEYRYLSTFNAERQLEFAKRIMAVRSRESRELAAELLREAAHLQRQLEKVKEDAKEFQRTLEAIDARLQGDQTK